MITSINEWSLFNKQNSNNEIKNIIAKVNTEVNSYTDIYGPYSSKSGMSMKVEVDGKTVEVYKESSKLFPDYIVYINKVQHIVKDSLAEELFNLLIYKQSQTQ